MPTENTESAINVAINSLDGAINDHTQDAKISQTRALYGIIFLAIGFMMILMFNTMSSVKSSMDSKKDDISYVAQMGDTVEKNKTLLFVFVGLSVMNFGVFMTLHRHHLNEVAKARHYKLGFQRIQIAAESHGNEGYHTEVRQSLVEGAFTYNSAAATNSKKVGNPMPGHPTSDISTMFINKMLEAVEIKPAAKKP